MNNSLGHETPLRQYCSSVLDALTATISVSTRRALTAARLGDTRHVNRALNIAAHLYPLSGPYQWYWCRMKMPPEMIRISNAGCRNIRNYGLLLRFVQAITKWLFGLNAPFVIDSACRSRWRDDVGKAGATEDFILAGLEEGLRALKRSNFEIQTHLSRRIQIRIRRICSQNSCHLFLETCLYVGTTCTNRVYSAEKI